MRNPEILGGFVLDALCGTKPPKSRGFRARTPKSPGFWGFVPQQILGKLSVSYDDIRSGSRGKAAEAIKQQQ